MDEVMVGMLPMADRDVAPWPETNTGRREPKEQRQKEQEPKPYRKPKRQLDGWHDEKGRWCILWEDDEGMWVEAYRVVVEFSDRR